MRIGSQEAARSVSIRGEKDLAIRRIIGNTIMLAFVGCFHVFSFHETQGYNPKGTRA